MKIDPNGNIIFEDTPLGRVPVKIGTDIQLNPGLEYLYYQNPGYKYPYSWAAQIPYINIVKWPDGKIELYSDKALNDNIWSDNVKNIDLLIKIGTVKFSIYVGTPSEKIVSQSRYFVNRQILLPICINFIKKYGTLNGSNLQTISISKTAFFNSKEYEKILNIVNSKPGIGNCEWTFFPSLTVSVTPTFPIDTLVGTNCNIENLTNWIQSRGINTTDLNNFPSDRYFDVKGIITPPAPTPTAPTPGAPTPPAPTPPAPTPPVPTPPAPTTPETAITPEIQSVIPEPDINMDVFQEPQEQPIETKLPDDDKFETTVPATGVGKTPLSSATTAQAGGLTSEVSVNDLGDWIESRGLDLKKQINEYESTVESTPIPASDELPVQPLVSVGKPLPLPEGFEVILEEGEPTGAIREPFLYPIGHPRWGEHHFNDRNAKIDMSKFCLIGSNCFGNHFEKLPKMYWFSK